MSSLDIYTLEGEDADEQFSTQDYHEAQQEARDRGCKLICNEYEFSDSYMVDDFTPNDYGPWFVDTPRPIRVWSAGGFK
jgi:hypothetical protein